MPQRSGAAIGSARSLANPGIRTLAATGTGAPPPGRLQLRPPADSMTLRESRVQALGIWKPRRRIFGQAAEDDGFEVERYVGTVVGQRLGFLVQVRGQHLHRGSAGE